MKHTEVGIIITVLAGALIFHQHVAAQYNVPYGVIGSGGAALTSGSYGILGTLGQPAIGRLTGASNIHEVGFWYLPNRITTGVKQEPDKGLPTEYRLEQNYPNPFNPATTIAFSLPSKQSATLKVYDVLGREVAVLINESKEPGKYIVSFDASGLPSGTYFYRLQAGSFVATKKLMLLR